MRRTRNPRYAPEWLERKLSPSGFLMGPALVSSYSTAAPVSSDPPVDDGYPPLPPPTPPPTGPAGPA